MSDLLGIRNLRRKAMALVLGLGISSNLLAQEPSKSDDMPKQDTTEVKAKEPKFEANAGLTAITSVGGTYDVNDQGRKRSNFNPYMDVILSGGVTVRPGSGRVEISVKNTDLLIMSPDGKFTPILSALESKVLDTKSGWFFVMGPGGKAAGTALFNGMAIDERYHDDAGYGRYAQKYNEIAAGKQFGDKMIKVGVFQETDNDWIFMPNMSDTESLMAMAEIRSAIYKNNKLDIEGSLLGAYGKDNKLLQATVTAKMPKTAFSVTGNTNFEEYCVLVSLAHEVSGMGHLMAEMDMGNDYKAFYVGADISKCKMLKNSKLFSALQVGAEYTNVAGNQQVGGRVTAALNLGRKGYKSRR